MRNDGSWIGALQNSGKLFFLQVAADSVRDLNAQRAKRKRNITYAQKAMVRCGLACVDGAWIVHHLSQELQRIVSDHNGHFLGEPVFVISFLKEQEAYV